MSEQSCAFVASDYCTLDDHRCGGKCRRFVRQHAALSYKDHYDIFIRRNEKKTDLLIRWIAIAIAFVSVLVTLVVNMDKIRNSSQGAPLPPHSQTAFVLQDRRQSGQSIFKYYDKIPQKLYSWRLQEKDKGGAHSS